MSKRKEKKFGTLMHLDRKEEGERKRLAQITFDHWTQSKLMSLILLAQMKWTLRFFLLLVIRFRYLQVS